MKKQPRFFFILTPRKARFLYFLLGLFPFGMARQMRRDLGHLLNWQPPKARVVGRVNGVYHGPKPKNPRKNGKG